MEKPLLIVLLEYVALIMVTGIYIIPAAFAIGCWIIEGLIDLWNDRKNNP